MLCAAAPDYVTPTDVTAFECGAQCSANVAFDNRVQPCGSVNFRPRVGISGRCEIFKNRVDPRGTGGMAVRDIDYFYLDKICLTG